MVLVVKVDQIRDIWDLGQILGLTHINSIFTIWRINRGQPLNLAKISKSGASDDHNLVKRSQSAVPKSLKAQA